MGNTADEPDFKVKAELQTLEKHAIARAAAELVRPGSSVAISGGSTTRAVAQALRDVPRLTVITNSLPVADVMHATGLAAIATLDAADVLVTDGGLSFDARRVLEARVGRLIIAESVGSAESPPAEPGA